MKKIFLILLLALFLQVDQKSRATSQEVILCQLLDQMLLVVFSLGILVLGYYWLKQVSQKIFPLSKASCCWLLDCEFQLTLVLEHHFLYF